MTKEDDENFKSSTKFWVCDNNFVEGDVKVIGHCHFTGKCRGAALWDCNISVVSLNYKHPVVFHNLKNYDVHLIMQELGKFDFKINVMPDGLKKYTCFNLDNKLVFIDSFQFLSSLLDILVKTF